MTAICGIVSLEGAVVSAEDLRLMVAALAHHGTSGQQIQYAEFVSLGLQTITASAKSRLGNTNSLLITADVRLDNRTDLINELGFAGGGPSDITDADLILSAYEKWEERCPERLLGDFAFAIWDSRKRRLFCARDHMGLRPLFYYHDDRRFIFGSEPKAIVALSGVPRKVNRNRIAALAHPEVRSRFYEESWFEEIKVLQAATSLTVEQARIRKTKFWEPQLSLRLPYRTDAEVLEAFRSLMFEVVSARLCNDQPAAALLSGGLDSSAVVSVAARALERQNKELHVLSAVLADASDPVLTDEREFIDQFRPWPNVTISYVTAPGRGPFDNLEQLVWNFDSPLITSRHYLYSAFAHTAKALGAWSILDGAGGELGPSYYGDFYEAELFWRFRWVPLWREMRARKRSTGTSMLRGLHASAFHPVIAPAMRRLRSREERPSDFSLGQILQPQFVRNQLDSISPWLNEQRKRESGWPNHRRIQYRQQLSVQQKATGIFPIGGQTALLYPFLDKRMLEFCLAAPGHLKLRNGYRRYLIRAGLDKILPPRIQWRTSKVPFSPDYLRRYNAQRQQAQSILADIGPNDPVRMVVNVERLKELANLPVAEDEYDTLAEFAARDAVPMGIHLILFLRRFDEYRN